MYCGGCFRDNSLVAALRRLGHDVVMVPLYLPLQLEDQDQSTGTPLFFSGVNVYLQQKYAFARRLPHWVNRLLAHPALLRGVGRKAAQTRPEEAGDLTLSMLQGEDGRQARELDELIGWLKTQGKIDVVCLSNSLLAGMARKLKRELNVKIACTFQGEDGFIDGLPREHSNATWLALTERVADIDLFVAPSHYYAALMRRRLELSEGQVKVVPNGIDLTGYLPAPEKPSPPVLGYFARLCPEKGLDQLVEAYLVLKHRDRIPNLKLHIGGSLGPADEPFVLALEQRLRRHGAMRDTLLLPNPDRAAKQAFYRGLSVLSVPVRHGEAFGLFVIEAMATGVPVVLPAKGAFPELVKVSQGGLLFEPGKANALADAVEAILLNPDRHNTFSIAALQSARSLFTIDRMARDMAAIYQELCNPSAAGSNS